MRTLRYYDWEWPRLDSSVFDRVGVTRPVLHFLPSLRTLELELGYNPSLLSVPLFFTPTLTQLSLSITGQQDEEHIHYAIGEIQRSSRLTCLKLFGCFQHVPRVIATLKVIQYLERLESVHIDLPPPMFAFVFAALLGHPKLKHVRLSYRKSHISDVEQDGLTPPSNSNGITMLQTIAVDRYASRTLGDPFNGRQFESIREFKATKVSVQSSEGVQQFLSNLIAACPLLEVFHASFTTPRPSITLDYHAVAPIVLHAGLRDLRISSHHPLILSRSDIAKICRILGPSIEILSLNPSPTWRDNDGRSLSNLSGLFPIARNCYRLRHLGIFLDATVPSAAPASLLIPRFSPTLEDIDFGTSEITGPVIKFLVSMSCPPVKVDPSIPACLHASWTAVAEGVELMRNLVGEVGELHRIDEELRLQLQEVSVKSDVEEEEEAIHGLEAAEGTSTTVAGARHAAPMPGQACNF